MYKNDRISTSFTVEQSHYVACSRAFFFFLGTGCFGFDDDDDDDDAVNDDDDDDVDDDDYEVYFLSSFFFRCLSFSFSFPPFPFRVFLSLRFNMAILLSSPHSFSFFSLILPLCLSPACAVFFLLIVLSLSSFEVQYGYPCIISSGFVAHIDADKCRGCGTCEQTCPFGAIRIQARK